MDIATDNHLSERPRTGAQAVVDALVNGEVEVIFGYPGGAIMPIYDAIYGARNQIRHVLVRHEQGATHAAQGYARCSLRPGVCMGTSGPGATNLLTGLADAMMDSTPLLAITGQVPTAALGTDAFQESDIVGMSLPVTKWSYQITDPNEVEAAVFEGLRITQTGRPGPVLIDVAKDAQMSAVTVPDQAFFLRDPGQRPHMTSDGLQPLGFDHAIGQACELLNAAERPMIFAGHGVLISGAQAELVALAETGHIPVANTLLGLSSIPTDHPLYVGMLGMHGNYAPNLLTDAADVVLAVGMRFDDRVTGDLSQYAREAEVIHIDIDSAEIGKCVPAAVGIVSDARPALAALQTGLVAKDRTAWRERFVELELQELDVVTRPALDRPNDQMSMVQVIATLSEHAAGQAIVVSDVGQHQMHAARHFNFRLPNTHITSGGLGTMGFALPAAIGVTCSNPETPVVAVAGDGGFQMNIQELGTILQEQLPVKIVILNNDYLGMVRQWQELFFDRRYSEVRMQNPDFITICRGYGITAERVETRDDLDAAIERMFEHAGPYLLDVAVTREENVFPMIPAGSATRDIRLS